MTATVVDLAPATFEAFWNLQYHKVDKVLAELKWDAITTTGLDTRMLDRDSGQFVEVYLKATPEEIIAGHKLMMKHWPRSADFSLIDPQYLVRPVAFLNRGRWKDGG